MTKLLEKAFKEVSKLPEIEQNAIAKWLLEELDADREWEQAFTESEEILTWLADEALEDQRKGKTIPLDIENL